MNMILNLWSVIQIGTVIFQHIQKKLLKLCVAVNFLDKPDISPDYPILVEQYSKNPLQVGKSIYQSLINLISIQFYRKWGGYIHCWLERYVKYASVGRKDVNILPILLTPLKIVLLLLIVV